MYSDTNGHVRGGPGSARGGLAICGRDQDVRVLPVMVSVPKTTASHASRSQIRPGSAIIHGHLRFGLGCPGL